MKKFFLKISLAFWIFSICFIFNVVEVKADEIIEEDILEEYEINALSAAENEDGESYINFDEIFNSFFCSPVMNYFYESSDGSTKLSYSGSNYILCFQDLLGRTKFYTGGNLVYEKYKYTSYQSYRSYFYPIHEKMYFIDNSGMLFISTGVLNYGYSTGGGTIVNCVVSSGNMTGSDAAKFCLNHSDELLDPDYMEKNGLTNRYIYNSWTEDGKFNPWVDGSKNRSKLDTNFEPSKVTIPDDASGCYIDYLEANPAFTNFTMKRCYYNGLSGEYTLDAFENYITGGVTETINDRILIIGVGAYWVDDVLERGFMESPNLVKHNVTSWSYSRIGWEHYNSKTAFCNSTCSDEFKNVFHINADTTSDDIKDNTGDREPELGIFESIFHKLGIDGFGQVFTFLDDYIKSMTTNINRFGDMVKVVFQWLPEPVLNLLIFSLIAFIAILLIKLILHLL